MTVHVSAAEIEAMLLSRKNDEQHQVLTSFFKTGKGEYGEGDEFLGLRVAETRAVVKAAKCRVAFPEIEKLLHSRWHEVRLSGLLLLVEEMKANIPRKSDKDDNQKAARRKEIAEFYMAHARQANNWDLVDLSAPYIVGVYIRLADATTSGMLYDMAECDNLWLQRISIVSTLDLIRHGLYEPTMKLADKMLGHPHDLIHKAIGWTLREIGKKDKDVLTDYLEGRYAVLPRTSLRYAIERFPEPERLYWLRRK